MRVLVSTAVAGSLVLLGLSQELRYDTEYPEIAYSATRPSGSVARLEAALFEGEVTLEREAGRGYLGSLLRELGIPVDSQVLVFSKTSFQTGLISPETPRAIYFNDDTYVAFVPGAPKLEIAAVDPRLGAVFYTLDQNDRPRFTREGALCLRCHDSYSLTGGGVPRFLVGSGLPDASGRLAYHEGWNVTTDRTPIDQRWGGFYVTGTGGGPHQGNRIVRRGPGGMSVDTIELRDHVATGRYLGAHSDVVALFVLEHQIHVQNALIRTSWDVRTAAPDAPLEPLAEPLVRALLLAGEAPLVQPVEGSSSFARRFSRRGPRDGRGRSLRELDLVRRLFRYPCSYVIYSEAFDALPDAARAYVYRRLGEILKGEDATEPFAHLSTEDRRTILEILLDTKEEFAREVR